MVESSVVYWVELMAARWVAEWAGLSVAKTVGQMARYSVVPMAAPMDE